MIIFDMSSGEELSCKSVFTEGPPCGYCGSTKWRVDKTMGHERCSRCNTKRAISKKNKQKPRGGLIFEEPQLQEIQIG